VTAVTSCDDNEAFDDSGNEALADSAENKLLPVLDNGVALCAVVEFSDVGINVTDRSPIVWSPVTAVNPGTDVDEIDVDVVWNGEALVAVEELAVVI